MVDTRTISSMSLVSAYYVPGMELDCRQPEGAPLLLAHSPVESQSSF